MNQVILIGRLTRDPAMRYTGETAIVSFSLAIDRPTAPGREKQADFPRVTVFGKQAETCERYLSKGRQVAVQGRLQTGSYKNKEGVTVYTTDVVADRVEFLDRGDRASGSDGDRADAFGGRSRGSDEPAPGSAPERDRDSDVPEGFTALDDDDDDIPF